MVFSHKCRLNTRYVLSTVYNKNVFFSIFQEIRSDANSKNISEKVYKKSSLPERKLPLSYRRYIF